MKKLLLVEDEQTLREVYASLFKLENFEVHEAANGKEALDMLGRIKPDVIVLDILMPVMGGVEFLERAKLKQSYPNTKVLVLTNLSDEKTLHKITENGAAKYELKASLSPRELAEAVRKL